VSDLEALKAKAASLREAACEAEDAHSHADGSRANLIHQRTRAQAAVITAMVRAEQQSTIDQLGQRAAEARAAADAAGIEAGNAELAAMSDPRRVEWARGKYLSDAYRATGRTGQYEVWTRETVCAAGRADYSLPRIGELFLRINKKDGTPSANFERASGLDRRCDPGGWHPVDWNPGEKS
jgi:hypothetical protein